MVFLLEGKGVVFEREVAIINAHAIHRRFCGVAVRLQKLTQPLIQDDLRSECFTN